VKQRAEGRERGSSERKSPKDRRPSKERKLPRFDLAQHPMFYMAHILHRNAENVAATLRPSRFDPSAWRILATLQYRDGLTIKELSRFSVLERSFVSRVVLKLEREGVVQRRTSAHDRREVRVTLTRKGLEVFHTILLPATQRQVRIAFEGVSRKDMDVLFSVLGRAMSNVYAAGNGFPPL
jgi:DNA-binding MarR family transcriptional regulator